MSAAIEVVRSPTQHPLWSDQLAADLAVLERAYEDHQEQFPSDWLDYGELDPAENDARLVFPPLGGLPKPVVDYRKVRRGSMNLHEHRIVSGQVSLGPFREGWQAVIEWNKSKHSVKPNWRDLPFFFIGELEPEDAKRKLGAMRMHLEMRARLLKMRAMSGQQVGRGFLNRIKAYLAWCELSQMVLKAQISHARIQ